MERLCLMLGSALVLAAVCLYVYDRLEDARAGAQAASAVSQLRQSQSIAAVSEAERPADSAESLSTEDAESKPESASETPASSIEREYLGVLTIPALGLELPVQTESRPAVNAAVRRAETLSSRPTTTSPISGG